MTLSRVLIPLGAAMTVGLGASPALAAQTLNCGKATFAEGKITKITTKGGSCATAKVLAKKYAHTRAQPAGYSCKETPNTGVRARVTCRSSKRTITFSVAWSTPVFPPAASTPIAMG